MLKIRFISKSLKASMKNKLILAMVVFNLIPLMGLITYTYFNSKSDVTREFIYSGTESLNRGIGLINNELYKYSQKCDNIISNGDNGDIIDKLNIDYGSDLVEKVLFYNSINIFINNMQLFDDPGRDIITFYISNKSLYENRYFKFLENSPNKSYIRKSVLNVTASSSNIWYPMLENVPSDKKYIYLYRNLLPDTENSTVLEIKIPFSTVDFYLKNMDVPKNSLILYKDAQDKIVFCWKAGPEGQELDTGSIDFNQYVILQGKLLNSHKIAVAVSKAEVRKRVLSSLSLIIPISAFALFYIFMASVLTSRRITYGLQSFIDTINNDADCLNNFSSVNVTGDDEVASIKRKFKELAQTINSLNEENLEVLKRSNQLEINILQSKINPHLLYNSLSAIKWTAQRRNDGTTVAMVDSLTRYYRKVLSKGEDVIKLRDELSMITEYVNIMSFSHACSYQLDIKDCEQIAGMDTIKLLLQPIVENAIMHGLSGKEGEKHILIEGGSQEDFTILSVTDNGYGMSSETIEKVLAMNYQSNYGGYGMKNLITRIRNFYGSNSRMEIESEQGLFTRVTLFLERKNN